MREIEFRGWDIDNNRWVYGYYVKRLDSTPDPLGATQADIDAVTHHYIIRDGFSDWLLPKPWLRIDVDPKSVGQWSGFYDVNKNRIYEGDLVSTPTREAGIVDFVDGGLWICYNDGSGDKWEDMFVWDNKLTIEGNEFERQLSY